MSLRMPEACVHQQLTCRCRGASADAGQLFCAVCPPAGLSTTSYSWPAAGGHTAADRAPQVLADALCTAVQATQRHGLPQVQGGSADAAQLYKVAAQLILLRVLWVTCLCIRKCFSCRGCMLSSLP